MFTKKSPEELGIASKDILNFINDIEEKNLGVHSFILLRHGAIAAEGWWKPYAPEKPHMLFSLSKSFTSTAVGLAVEEGLLSVDDPVISFFPDDLPQDIGKNLADMKIRHLLSMSTGHDQDTTGELHKHEDQSWVKTFLSLPVEHEPGTHFVYNSGASYMLSAIVQLVTGQKVNDYLKPRLYDRLGIEDTTWDVSPQGINTGGWGLSVKTEDIARFGQMYLQKGTWNGQRILSEKWVEEATTSHISNGDCDGNNWGYGYGYQFWRCPHAAYRGDGAFGQYCIVMPDQDAILAATSGTDDMGAVMNAVWEHLLLKMQDTELAPDETHYNLLKDKLSSLELPPTTVSATSPLIEKISGKLFKLTDDNGSNFELSLVFKDDQCNISIAGDVVNLDLTYGLGRWIEAEKMLPGQLFGGTESRMKVAAKGIWVDDNSFEAICYIVETPFRLKYRINFSGDDVELDTFFGPGANEQPPALRGKMV